VSTLQCPATLVLGAPGTEPPESLRIAHEWLPDEVPDLLSDDLWTLREALADLADRTPGETTWVPVLDDRLRAALPRLARVEVSPESLAAAPVLTLDIDADDWVCRALP
jgi:hypothetical protein